MGSNKNTPTHSPSGTPSGTPEANRSQKMKNKQIEKMLREEKKSQHSRQLIKLLLLGPGESGKSTILKQFKLIYTSDFSSEEREQYRKVLVSNVLECAKRILNAMLALDIKWESEKRK
ncbi:hypothetical protein HK096_008452, partial [Nowakowskiella sp. JEL0078]